MQSDFEIIRSRTSVRAFANTPVGGDARQALAGLMERAAAGPLGNRVRYQLLDLDQEAQQEARRYGTYGLIKGARLFVLCAIRDQPGAREDLGYCMEEVILGATRLGLGTCWMGGTFKRGRFAERLGLAGDEILPIISPLGYPRKRRTLVERAIRAGAGSNRRKPREALFFQGPALAPLDEAAAGQFSLCLEAVRLAPSASNKQPWRLVMDSEGRGFHFFLQRTRGYDRLFGGINLQNIDIGIAMCHFEVGAREQGLDGGWQQTPPGSGPEGAEYIISWRQRDEPIEAAR